ncbi:MAG: hypothetical protein BWK78_04530 [Thiotrichaceae bacterium IS1]|nr:MAG: hypothetical protein BWK78_04530 [Thiotrichaceae bacterium IS1]
MAGSITERIIEQAYLFGQMGNALFEQDGQCFMVSIEDNEPVLCQGREIGLLYDAISEYSTVQNVTLENLREKLDNLYYAYEALSFSLNGLDPNLEKEVRSSVIEMANELCQDEQVYTFVSNRLLGYPFPLHDEKEANEVIKNAIEATDNKAIDKIAIDKKEANEAAMEGAIEAANGKAAGVNRLKKIYEELGKNRQRLQTFHEVWQAVVPKFFFFADETEQARALRFFVDKGIVRGLVTANSRIDDLQKKVSEKPTEFDGIFEELPREILGKLLTKLAEKFEDVTSASYRPPEKIDTLFVNSPPESIVEENSVEINIANFQTPQLEEKFSHCKKVAIRWDENTPEYGLELISFCCKIRIQCNNYDLHILVWGVPIHRQSELSPLADGRQYMWICDKLDKCLYLSRQ